MAAERSDVGLVIFLVGLTQLIVTTDFSIVSVALPSIGAHLHIPPASLSWVISAAALTGGGFLILAGRAADIFGQRRCLLVGLTLFAAGSVGSAAAPALPMLIAARAVQGLGGAILAPANFSLINILVPPGAPRRRALGVFGIMQGLSLVIGLLIGGALTTHVGWRAVFLLNPPIVLLAIAITLRVVPRSTAVIGSIGRQVDWMGAILIVVGMGLGLMGISAMGREGLGSPRAIGLIVGGLVSFVLFFFVEGRVPAPLAPLSMFGRRNFTAASVIMILHLGGIGGVFVLLSLYMQTGLHMTAFQTGLGMMPYAAFVMLAGQIAPGVMARMSHRAIVVVAFALYALGLCLFALLSMEANYWLAVALGSVATALGATSSFVALMADATSDIPEAQQGAASAVLFTAQQIGIPLGATAALAMLGIAGPLGLLAFRNAYALMAGVVIVALLLVLTTLRPTPDAVPDAVVTKA